MNPAGVVAIVVGVVAGALLLGRRKKAAPTGAAPAPTPTPGPTTQPTVRAAPPGRPPIGIPPPPGQRPVPGEIEIQSQAAFMPVLYEWGDDEWVPVQSASDWRRHDANYPGFMEEEIEWFERVDFSLDFFWPAGVRDTPYYLAALWGMGYVVQTATGLAFATEPVVIKTKQNWS